MKKLPFLLLALLGLTVAGYSWDIDFKWEGPKILQLDTTWHNDILEGYEARYVPQGIAFDGPCQSTIVRKLAAPGTRRAYLYIHGFNDYFFQKEMGERFVDSGYNFYAVDLRRYGRSKLEWQYPYNIRKMDEYFADIDSALAQIRRDGNTDVTLSGHSTGGLTVLYYAAMRAGDCGVDRVVTDSPFIEWNFSAGMRNFVIPIVEFFSKFSKDSKITQGHCDGYAYSLLKQFHGQWEYDTDWKMIYSPPVTYSWIGAINSAQRKLMKRAGKISVPVLVMHSSRKIEGCGWTPEFQTGDAVLDPFMIEKRGRKMGRDPWVCRIDSGLHDLILSEPVPREAAYDTIFQFIMHNS